MFSSKRTSASRYHGVVMICVQKLLKHKITSSRTGSRHIRWSLTGGSQWHGYTTQLFLFRPGSPLGQRWTVHSAHHMARIQSGWKSAQRDANTARPSQSPHRRTESAMAVVRQSQNSPPPAADPLPGGAGPPKFNQVEMVTTFTYRSSLMKIDARNFELSW